MDIDSIKEEMRSFLSKYIRKDFQNDQNFFKTGLLNSLFAMQMVLFVEKKFNLNVESKDLNVENFNSVNAISNFVQQKTTS